MYLKPFLAGTIIPGERGSGTESTGDKRTKEKNTALVLNMLVHRTGHRQMNTITVQEAPCTNYHKSKGKGRTTTSEKFLINDFKK